MCKNRDTNLTLTACMWIQSRITFSELLDVLNIYYTVFEESEELWKDFVLLSINCGLYCATWGVPLYSCDMGLACPWTQCWFCHPQIPPSYEQISLLNDRRMGGEREDTLWHYECINCYKWLLKPTEIRLFQPWQSWWLKMRRLFKRS